ncbi:hypothetical protein Tco_1227812, partial [Tanacetum coccineum]
MENLMVTHQMMNLSDHRIKLWWKWRFLVPVESIHNPMLILNGFNQIHHDNQKTYNTASATLIKGQSVSSYVLKMKGYIDNLERLGHPVTLGLAVSLILIGLRKEFDGFVQNYNMHSPRKTVNELHAMLKLHEQTLTLPKNNVPALHAIRAGKVQKGHWKRNYPQYLAELLKKKKNAASRAGSS